MKPLDKFLQRRRTRMALAACPPNAGKILDIGCGEDAWLLQNINAPTRHGIDPLLTSAKNRNGIELFPESFPENIESLRRRGPYDAIFALAVFEHLSEAQLAAARQGLPDLLTDGGRLVITLPDPLVDHILEWLKALRLIDGMELHQHHGFQPKEILLLNSERLVLSRHRKFQLGLNNLFVFTKR